MCDKNKIIKKSCIFSIKPQKFLRKSLLQFNTYQAWLPLVFIWVGGWANIMSNLASFGIFSNFGGSTLGMAIFNWVYFLAKTYTICHQITLNFDCQENVTVFRQPSPLFTLKNNLISKQWSKFEYSLQINLSYCQQLRQKFAVSLKNTKYIKLSELR